MHPWEQLSLLVVFAVILMATGVSILPRYRRSADEREERRRTILNARGRVGDAMVTEVDENTIYYSYRLGGVVYSAAQDISALRELLPKPLERLVGPATLKYDPSNPANSIVICERWSGLRADYVVRRFVP